jgi:protein phosphatase 2C family protein 2/3
LQPTKMVSYRRSNDFPSTFVSPRGNGMLNPSFVKNLHRAVSLNNASLTRASFSSQNLLSSPIPSPYLSPTNQKLRKSPAARLPSLPALSSTVKSSRAHGIVKAYCANTHKGLVRNTNEDRVMIISKIAKPANKLVEKWPLCSYFGVYDGHMGKECCNFLRDNLHNFIIQDDSFPSDPAHALIQGFSKAEEEFLNYSRESNTKSGSCAIVVLIVKKTCYLANLGDSRGLLSESKMQKITQISTDHVPHDEQEKKRVQLAGGEVVYSKQPGNIKQFVSRIMPGGISVSRAFGDVDAKLPRLGGNPNVLIAVPEVRSFRIHSDADFLVVASDGIFERIENMEVVNIINQAALASSEGTASEKIARGVEKVLIEAMIRESTDNLTAVVIAFKRFCNEIQGVIQSRTGWYYT